MLLVAALRLAHDLHLAADAVVRVDLHRRAVGAALHLHVVGGPAAGGELRADVVGHLRVGLAVEVDVHVEQLLLGHGVDAPPHALGACGNGDGGAVRAQLGGAALGLRGVLGRHANLRDAPGARSVTVSS